MLSFEFGGLQTLEPLDFGAGDFVFDVRLVGDKNKYRRQHSFAKLLTPLNNE